MKKEEILRIIEEKKVYLIRCLYIGFDGVTRGRVAGKDKVLSNIEDGIGVSQALQAWNCLDEFVAEGRYGNPIDEFRIMPDIETFTVLPYTQNSAVMMVDMFYEGEPWEVCARSFLKNMVKQLDSMGYAAQCAIENEWYLLKMKEGELMPFDDELTYSAAGMNTADNIISEIVINLQEMGLSVEQYHVEQGHAQQELVISHADPLRAADNQVILKETIKGVVCKNDLYASFMPKPFQDLGGNGGHLHLSLYDKEGKNVLYEENDPYHLSPIGYHFIGGILAHIKGLMAITASTVNSYKRLTPGVWASAFASFGLQNRESAIRICGGRPENHNFEYKPIDPCCNPYLAIGAVLAAGMDGIQNQIDPGERGIDVDPVLIDPIEREKRGIFSYPDNLACTLDELSKDAFFKKAMGEVMVEEYVKVKRSEWNSFKQHVTDWEIKNYITTF